MESMAVSSEARRCGWRWDSRLGIAVGPGPSAFDGAPVDEPTGHRQRTIQGIWAAACVALLSTACGGASPTSSMSHLASDYTNEILGIMQDNSMNAAKINWTDFRAQVIQRAQGAQTIPDLHPAISTALGLLGDHHSSYYAASGTAVSNPTALNCSAASVASPVIPVDIGYVRIAGFPGSDADASLAFADDIENQIRSRDAPGIAGWVVDLRGNTGGNMWPMIAGVGSVLGEGVAGYWIPPSMPWLTGSPRSTVSRLLQTNP